MEVFGSLDSKDGSGRLKRGPEFPPEPSVKDGDLFAMVDADGAETLYIRSSGTWIRVLLDSEEIDAGTY